MSSDNLQMIYSSFFNHIYLGWYKFLDFDLVRRIKTRLCHSSFLISSEPQPVKSTKFRLCQFLLKTWWRENCSWYRDASPTRYQKQGSLQDINLNRRRHVRHMLWGSKKLVSHFENISLRLERWCRSCKYILILGILRRTHASNCLFRTVISLVAWS